MSLIPRTSAPELRADPASRQREQSWAHVSGWAQLSGSRQTVSCILPCRDQGHILAKLLPILSDTLTECGYPWEMIVVDADSRDGTSAVMAAWLELPGFRAIRLDASADLSEALAAGLRAARGDAVIVFDPGLHHSPELIPSMILRWEADAHLVYAVDAPGSGSRLVEWDGAALARRIARDDLSLPERATDLLLMDRSFVGALLGA